MTTKEILKIINAYKEGKTIEYRFKFDLDVPANRSYEWDYEVPSSGDYNWNFAMYEYRIKEEQKLRPYNNIQEFFNAYREHGPYYIQKDLKEHECYFLPGNIDNEGFWPLHGSYCTFSEFAQSYEWQDGTRCGIEED